MKAIILSAGYGTRIRPLSNYLPKPLLPVVGQPLLRHIIMKLRACKVDGIGINTHHNAEMVEAFIAREQSGPPVMLSREEVILGSGGGIGGFKNFLRGGSSFIVHNGDVLSNIPLELLIAAHEKENPLCTLILHDHPPYNNVLIDKGSSIIDMRDVLKPERTFKRLAYTGIALMNTRILEYIPDGVSDIVDILIKIIRAGKEHVLGLVVENRVWKDVGTVKNYFEAHQDILLNRKPLIDEAAMPTGSVFLGEGTVKEDGVVLKGFVSAGSNCVIKKGALVENSIIWDRTVIEKNEAVKNKIIGPGWAVDPFCDTPIGK